MAMRNRTMIDHLLEHHVPAVKGKVDKAKRKKKREELERLSREKLTAMYKIAFPRREPDNTTGSGEYHSRPGWP